MIINATSHTMKNIWRLFLFIFLIFTLVFLILTNGIRIENIKLPKINISQLYIKLDKKLIVSAKTVQIKSDSKTSTSLAEIKELSSYLPYIYGLFKSVSIRELLFDNEKMHFLYKDEVFYIDSEFLTIDAKIKPLKDYIELDIEKMILKDYQSTMNGKVKLYLFKKIYDFNGNFKTFNINGEISLKIENKILYYRLNTQSFNSLTPFMDFLSKKTGLSPLIGDWIYKKIVAKEYKINNLEGKFNLKTNDFYPKLMSAKAIGKDVFIKFDKEVPAATTKHVEVILDNDRLTFNLEKAKYEGKDVFNPEVYIYNLMTNDTGIVVDINTIAKFDDSIHKILHAFDIKIPITQQSGLTKASLLLNLKFDPFKVRNYIGLFELKDSNLSISNLPLYTKGGTIELDNNLIHIKNANLKYNELFDIYTSGTFNTDASTYKSENQIKSVHVSFDKLNILDIRDLNTTSTLSIHGEKTSIWLDNLRTNLEFFEQNNKITVKDLSLLYPHSNIMKKIDFKSGDLTMNTKDFKSFNIITNLKDGNLPLLENGKIVKELKANIKTDGQNVNIDALNGKIKINYKDTINIFLKNLDLLIDSSKENNSSGIKKLKIEGINSNIFDKNSSLEILSTKYNFEMDNSNITFNNKFYNQEISLKKDTNNIFLNSENLSDVFINTLLDKKAFENGTFKISILGENLNKLDGTFIAKETTIKGLSFFNNIIAFINTVPSLITLKNPGFNDDGYEIKEGTVSFSRDGAILYFNKINLDGISTDITGAGTVNLKTKKVNIDLKIEVLKSFSSVVKNIPLVGYIFLGDDGKINTNINIKGTTDKLDIKTNVMTDTAISPINIIKRTLKTPFRVFE